MRSAPRFPCGHLRWRGLPVTISLTSSESRFLYLILMRERAEYTEQRDFAQIRLIDALHRQLGAPGAQAVNLSLGIDARQLIWLALTRCALDLRGELGLQEMIAHFRNVEAGTE
jgi:hypothetical protein